MATFAVSATERDAHLIWQTATENNSSRFEIERAKDATSIVWEKIGSQKAMGTTTQTTNYSFTDAKLNTGKYYYRIKVVDVNGSAVYSKQIECKVDAPKSYAIGQNYPNPFNPSTKIEFQLQNDSRVVLELYSMTGEKKAEILNEEKAAGYYSVDVKANSYGLPSGVYIYRIVAKGKAQGSKPFIGVKKMLLVK